MEPCLVVTVSIALCHFCFLCPLTSGRGDADPLFTTKQKHVGAVRGLDFNPFQSSLLASGGAGGEVCLFSFFCHYSTSDDNRCTSGIWPTQALLLLLET